MITTVFIDVDDTLLDFDKCAQRSIQKALEDINIPFDDSFFSVFTQVNNSLWEKLEKRRITKDELYSKRWDMIFERFGIKYDGALFEKSFLYHLNNSAVCVPYANELLRYLYPRYTLCITSNAPHKQQLQRLKNADMLRYIYKVFTSEKIGIEKPDKKFFDACFAELGTVFAGEVMIIGDSLSADICGGAGYGMKTCWFNPRGNALTGSVKPDYIVSSLEEITNIL